MTYLKFESSIEELQPDEQETIDGIIKGMTHQSEIVEKREHHAVRASHAKTSGLVTGTLVVSDHLPIELAQGLFQQGGAYPIAVRFAQGPGETLGDRVSTHRGMAIKVLGVKGEKLPAHVSETQDFVFATGRTFPSGTASGFLSDAKQIGAATPLPEGVKSAVSAMARGFNKVLHAFGTESAKADFFGHPFTHPLSDAYFSQAPLRFGDYVAKLGAFPAEDMMARLADVRIDPDVDEDGFRHLVVDFFRTHEARFDLRVQLWANAETQPIEDASVEWPASDSPYRTVATLTLPPQDALSAARQHYFEEAMTFTPAHSLVAHRPLGSVMRARLQVYKALSDFRHRENGTVAKDTGNIADIPA